MQLSSSKQINQDTTQQSQSKPNSFQEFMERKDYLQTKYTITKEQITQSLQMQSYTQQKAHIEKSNPIVQLKKQFTQSKRRSKRDQQNRDYICGCGKNYFSYPALYTHIKQKHKGQAPIGTKSQASCNKRGRPRKDKEKSISNFNEAFQQDILLFYSPDTNETAKELFYNLVNHQDLHIIKIIDDRCLGECNPAQPFIPFRNCQDLSIQFHPFVQIMYQIQNNVIKEKLSKNSSSDLVITVFLMNLSKIFNYKYYQFIALLFRAYRECAYQDNQQIKQEYVQQDQTDETCPTKKETTQKSQDQLNQKQEQLLPCSIDQLTRIPNYFIQQFLPKYVEEFNITFAIHILIDFFNWLEKLQLSNNKVNFLNPELLEEDLNYQDQSSLSDYSSQSDSDNSSSSSEEEKKYEENGSDQEKQSNEDEEGYDSQSSASSDIEEKNEDDLQNQNVDHSKRNLNKIDNTEESLSSIVKIQDNNNVKQEY